jgi:hypothetical protein
VRYCLDPTCAKKFPNPGELAIHNRERHGTNTPLKVGPSCPLCGDFSFVRSRSAAIFDHLVTCRARQHAAASASPGSSGFADDDGHEADMSSAANAEWRERLLTTRSRRADSGYLAMYSEMAEQRARDLEAEQREFREAAVAELEHQAAVAAQEAPWARYDDPLKEWRLRERDSEHVPSLTPWQESLTDLASSISERGKSHTQQSFRNFHQACLEEPAVRDFVPPNPDDFLQWAETMKANEHRVVLMTEKPDETKFGIVESTIRLIFDIFAEHLGGSQKNYRAPGPPPTGDEEFCDHTMNSPLAWWLAQYLRSLHPADAVETMIRLCGIWADAFRAHPWGDPGDAFTFAICFLDGQKPKWYPFAYLKLEQKLSEAKVKELCQWVLRVALRPAFERLQRGLQFQVGPERIWTRVQASVLFVLADEKGMRELFLTPGCTALDFPRMSSLASRLKDPNGPLHGRHSTLSLSALRDASREDYEILRRSIFDPITGKEHMQELPPSEMSRFPIFEKFGLLATAICVAHLLLIGLLRNHVIPKTLLVLMHEKREQLQAEGASKQAASKLATMVIVDANKQVRSLTRHGPGDIPLATNLFTVFMSRTRKAQHVRLVGRSSCRHMTGIARVWPATLTGTKPLIRAEDDELAELNFLTCWLTTDLEAEPFSARLVEWAISRMRSLWITFVDTRLTKVPGFEKSSPALPTMETLGWIVVKRRMLGPLKAHSTMPGELLNYLGKHLLRGIHPTLHAMSLVSTQIHIVDPDLACALTTALKRKDDGEPMGNAVAFCLPVSERSWGGVCLSVVARRDDCTPSEVELETVSGYWWRGTKVSLCTPRLVLMCVRSPSGPAQFVLPRVVLQSNRGHAWVFARTIVNVRPGRRPSGFQWLNGDLRDLQLEVGKQHVFFPLGGDHAWSIVHGLVPVLPCIHDCSYAPPNVAAQREQQPHNGLTVVKIIGGKVVVDTDVRSQTKESRTKRKREKLASHYNNQFQPGSLLLVSEMVDTGPRDETSWRSVIRQDSVYSELVSHIDVDELNGELGDDADDVVGVAIPLGDEDLHQDAAILESLEANQDAEFDEEGSDAEL